MALLHLSYEAGLKSGKEYIPDFREKKMAKENSETKVVCGSNAAAGGAGAVYGFGFLGALFYFLSHADSFVNGLLGVLKALIWPALMVYHLFGFLKL
jgi:hypothetical protein